jgi:hypothetical protein
VIAMTAQFSLGWKRKQYDVCSAYHEADPSTQYYTRYSGGFEAYLERKHDHDYLGLEITQPDADMVIVSQQPYAAKIVAAHEYGASNHVFMPITTDFTTASTEAPKEAPQNSAVKLNLPEFLGEFCHIKKTRPDLLFAHNTIASVAWSSAAMPDASLPVHQTVLARSLRYVNATSHLGICFRRTKELVMDTFSDASHGRELHGSSDCDADSDAHGSTDREAEHARRADIDIDEPTSTTHDESTSIAPEKKPPLGAVLGEEVSGPPSSTTMAASFDDRPRGEKEQAAAAATFATPTLSGGAEVYVDDFLVVDDAAGLVCAYIPDGKPGRPNLFTDVGGKAHRVEFCAPFDCSIAATGGALRITDVCCAPTFDTNTTTQTAAEERHRFERSRAVLLGTT